MGGLAGWGPYFLPRGPEKLELCSRHCWGSSEQLGVSQDQRPRYRAKTAWHPRNGPSICRNSHLEQGFCHGLGQSAGCFPLTSKLQARAGRGVVDLKLRAVTPLLPSYSYSIVFSVTIIEKPYCTSIGLRGSPTRLFKSSP